MSSLLNKGEEIYNLAYKIFSYCRSITGEAIQLRHILYYGGF